MLGISSNRENAIALDLDHRSICKFESQNDDYEQVEDNISELVEEAIYNARLNPPIGEDSPMHPPLIRSPTSTSGGQGGQRTPENALVVDSKNPSVMSSSLSEQDSLEDLNEGGSSTSPTSVDQIDPRKLERRQDKASSGLTAFTRNLKDSSGMKFRAAATEGKKDVLKIMIDQGQAIDNSSVRNGRSALAEAVVHGQEECVKLLLTEGANPAFICRRTSFMSKYGSNENTPLTLAAGKGHIGIMTILLDFHKYTTPELDAAFFAAKFSNRADAMRLLQTRGGGLY